MFNYRRLNENVPIFDLNWSSLDFLKLVSIQLTRSVSDLTVCFWLCWELFSLYSLRVRFEWLELLAFLYLNSSDRLIVVYWFCDKEGFIGLWEGEFLLVALLLHAHRKLVVDRGLHLLFFIFLLRIWLWVVLVNFFEPFIHLSELLFDLLILFLLEPLLSVQL